MIDSLPNSVPVLQAERLILRGLTAIDGPALFDILSDPRVTATTDIEPLERLEQAETLIDFFRTRFEQHRGAIRWGMSRKGDDKIIGTAGFPGWDDESRKAEIGYDVAYEHWGQGFATEAVRTLVRYGFEQLHFNRIEATTNLDNTASQRVLLKAGFSEEGVLRDWRYWGGKFHDLRMFSLLRREFATES